MYLLLIHKYYINIMKYKSENIGKIDLELSKIHQYIIQYKFDENSTKELEVYLKRQNYLYESKEKIGEISRFPLAIKAFITCISPIIPIALKFILSGFKNFF